MTYLDSVPAANDPGLAIWPIEELGPEQVAMRQLRHHTKNALQRLLCQVTSCRGLQQDTAGRALAADLERRIRLSADLSDALFGLTRAPLPLPGRLHGLVRAAVDMMSDGDQIITIEVTVDDDCGGPALDALGDLITKVAHELVGNAVKHGMHVRMVGRIAVRVRTAGDQALLTVSDDGWGWAKRRLGARGCGSRICWPSSMGGGCGCSEPPGRRWRKWPCRWIRTDERAASDGPADARGRDDGRLDAAAGHPANGAVVVPGRGSPVIR